LYAVMVVGAAAAGATENVVIDSRRRAVIATIPPNCLLINLIPLPVSVSYVNLLTDDSGVP